MSGLEVKSMMIQMLVFGTEIVELYAEDFDPRTFSFDKDYKIKD
jgi:hypothetical protein